MKLLLSLFLLLSTYTYANSIDPYKDIHYYKLDNGFQVYLLSDEKSENTQVELTVNVGYDMETDDTYGLSHLVEHMVFRDQRIRYHDYLDYIKEEGGTYVNGYTRRYQTGYLTTISSDKSYWIVETFSQMIFDKNITQKDIEVEKGALQTEIGETHWYIKPLTAIKNFFEKITPSHENFNQNEFGVKKLRDLPEYYYSQQNNQNFTYTQLMSHYHNYYYPANMTLMVVGNFSIDKMKELIDKKYGVIHKKGTKTVKEPLYNPSLNHKPFYRFYEGLDNNMAYIGAKFIVDDYKKYLILDAYTNNLAQRLQQDMRNKDGNTYSVNSYTSTNHKAGIASITFDALHDEFENNLKQAKAMLAKDIAHIDTNTIKKALESYTNNNYASIEHDNETLMGLIKTAKYLREEQNISNQSSYDIFKSITEDDFRRTLKNVFTSENSYSMIYRDYYFFPMEMGLLSLLSMGVFFFFYFRLYHFDLKRQNLLYTHRDILLHRRVSSRFTGFIIFLLIVILSNILWHWIKYLLSQILTGDPYYLFTIDVPYSYIATVLDPFIYMVLFLFLYRTLINYYARIDVIASGIIARGNRIRFIDKEDINSFEVMPYHFEYRKDTIGTVLRFWKPLLKVTMKNTNTVYYLRTTQAKHLKEDLEKALFE